MRLCCSRAPQALEELHFGREQFSPCSSPSCSIDNCFLLFWVRFVTSGAGGKESWGLHCSLSVYTLCFICGIIAQDPNPCSRSVLGQRQVTGIQLWCFYISQHFIPHRAPANLEVFHAEEGLPKVCSVQTRMFPSPADSDFLTSSIENELSW